MRLLAILLVGTAVWAQSSGSGIRIGYFGPADPDHPVGGTLWRGAELAVEEANSQGGYQGTPFRLVPDWDENPWTGGARVVVRMAYEEQVWAIIGGIDGTSTHLAEQVVAKAQLALIDPASTDRSVNAAFVPWMFSLMPDDRAMAAAIGAELFTATPGNYVLVAATDHDSRTAVAEFLRSAESRPRRRFDFADTGSSTPEIAAQVAAIRPAAVVLLAGVEASATMLRDLRQAGYEGAVYGGPAMGRNTFLERAGPLAEDVRVPVPAGTLDAGTDFARCYCARYGAPPDYAAVYGYDAVRLVVDVIRKAGLDRARIRDAVTTLAPWQGASGVVQWDEIGRNTAAVVLTEVVDGQLRAVGAGVK